MFWYYIMTLVFVNAAFRKVDGILKVLWKINIYIYKTTELLEIVQG